MEKEISYCGQKVKVGCDGNCNKAWGGNSRPRILVEDPKQQIFGYGHKRKYVGIDDSKIDVDNYVYLSDEELGDAPEDPQTYEGGDGKPEDNTEFPNKWCVRECERCVMSERGKFNEPLVFPDFSKRNYNINQ